jgi:hypothetical protein
MANLSWDSNDDPMDGPVTSRSTSERERENKTESEQGIRERKRRRVIKGDSATM